MAEQIAALEAEVAAVRKAEHEALARQQEAHEEACQ